GAKSMDTSRLTPLYPTYHELRDMRLSDYPDLKAFLEAHDAQSWRFQHWQWGLDFLRYIGRNKSEHTYNRFRNDIERFLLWVFLTQTVPVDAFRKTHILEYADFCWKPPVKWIGLVSCDRFIPRNGAYFTNPEWLPYRLKIPKSQNQNIEKPDKKK